MRAATDEVSDVKQLLTSLRLAGGISDWHSMVIEMFPEKRPSAGPSLTVRSVRTRDDKVEYNLLMGQRLPSHKESSSSTHHKRHRSSISPHSLTS